jgi:hypothetical protein
MNFNQPVLIARRSTRARRGCLKGALLDQGGLGPRPRSAVERLPRRVFRKEREDPELAEAQCFL